jgi:cytokinin riboside 5'-monophosphate phosphoribohydrolase
MKICVYCSSSNLIDKKYFSIATELGIWLAQSGHTLIYGGANVGLMDAVAQAYKNAGGKEIIGVIPHKIIELGITTTLADSIVEVADMKDRKAVMRSLGDGYIALAGSFGTLDEIIEELVLKQLNYHQKPVVFYDPTLFYEHLYNQFEVFFDEQFTDEKYKKLYTIATYTADLDVIFD